MVSKTAIRGEFTNLKESVRGIIRGNTAPMKDLLRDNIRDIRDTAVSFKTSLRQEISGLAIVRDKTANVEEIPGSLFVGVVGALTLGAIGFLAGGGWIALSDYMHSIPIPLSLEESTIIFGGVGAVIGFVLASAPYTYDPNAE